MFSNNIYINYVAKIEIYYIVNMLVYRKPRTFYKIGSDLTGRNYLHELAVILDDDVQLFMKKGEKSYTLFYGIFC